MSDDNNSIGFHESGFEPQAPGASLIPEGENLRPNETSFALPDSECFAVLAIMAGQIAAEESKEHQVNINQALFAIRDAATRIHNCFVEGKLDLASEPVAEVVFNALVIAGVCEANAPEMFSCIAEQLFNKPPFNAFDEG